MNYEQATQIIALLSELNDLQRHRNTQLTAIHNKLEAIDNELYEIRGRI